MTCIKYHIKGKLDLLQISKNQEPQFYTYVLELGLLKYLAPHHFLNHDNRQTKKNIRIQCINILHKIICKFQ